MARPNLMIKVPATVAGFASITQLIAEGINVNATLLFSLDHYRGVVEAYLAGLELRMLAGESLDGVASVASFFVSRIDTAVDKLLPDGPALRGKAGIANCKVAYAVFQQIFAQPRFVLLAGHGGRVQKFLCASTSVKNPEYRDVMYMEELIGPDTIDTVPPAALEAFRDHGHARLSITEELADAEQHLAALADAGIDLSAVCRDLQCAGVDAFAQSFHHLMDSLASKREEILARLHRGAQASAH